MDFSEWLESCVKHNNVLLKPASVSHYSQGLRTVSKDMLTRKTISKPLEEMDLSELDLAILLIFHDPFFLAKDKKGNKMYSNSLKKYRCFMAECYPEERAAEAEEHKIGTDPSLTPTEREALIKARVGQGLYRERLFKKFDGRCLITKINVPSLLIASHIKPWYVSSDKERLTGENGLLLSATYDRLFDSGLMTFEDNGAIHLSEMVTKENAEKLFLREGEVFDIKWTPEMGQFLEYHRDLIFSR